MTDIEDAADAVRAGELVVYPTETVYGHVETAAKYVDPTERERAFMREFLPGPVTVVCERRESVPDVLTAGKDRVGVRVPDHELALELLDAVAPTPITATSANVSGRASVLRSDDLDEEIRGDAAVVLDGGETAGTESTVVDVSDGTIHRRGAMADEIEAWLDEH